MKRKLEIDEYVFSYRKEDLKNAILEYDFDTITLVSYKNGVKFEDHKPLINFNIMANSSNKKYSFSFSLFGDLVTLNNFSNVVKINDYIVFGEVFLFDNGTCIILDDDLKDNIYKYTPSFFIEKVDNNKFVFKIQYEDIFIWFLSDFT
mgnify:FL=1